MRLIRLTVIVTALVAAFGDSPAAQETWTLEKCVAEALRNSHTLAVSRETVTGAAAGARASQAVRWPMLGVSGAYSYTSETQQLNIALPIPGLQMPSVKFGDGNIYDLAVTARAPLFAGGTVLERGRADAAARRSTEHGYAFDSLTALHEIRRAYFETLGAEACAAAARQAVTRINRHVEEIAQAITVGWQSEENRLAATAALRQMESAMIQADLAAQTARLQMGVRVGRPGDEIAPHGDLEFDLMDEKTLEQQEIETRAEMMSLFERIEQSRHLMRATRGSFLPSLAASASYHYGKPGVDIVQNEWMDYYVIGVSASWTLWDWNARRYQVQQTRASVHALEARQDDLKSIIITRRQM
ncbi:TolC family protein, partial [bacterium]|nr:TolC family protein [bacterium]